MSGPSGSRNDRELTGPRYGFITSTIIDYQKMMTDAVTAIMDGTFEFNTVHYYGLDSGVIRVADYHGLVPDEHRCRG